MSGLVKPDSYAEAASIARLAVPPPQIARKITGRHFRMFPQVSADSGTVRYAFLANPKKIQPHRSDPSSSPQPRTAIVIAFKLPGGQGIRCIFSGSLT
ncbi:hypothetical protein Bra5_CH00150 [Rhizobium phaseoli Brasil 5]|nr:hypothetical protein Bra5_CH00150 [Rhizobium phaseoli Brasil 5]